MSEDRFSRITKAVERNLSEEKYYDAHQMVRTLHRRFAKNQPEDAEKLVHMYALKFAEKGQPELASDLAQLLISHYQSTGQEPGVVLGGNSKFLEVFNAIPVESEHRNSAIQVALKWSAETEANGSPILHRAYGETFAARGEYATAIAHLVYCKDATALLAALKPWAKEGYATEEPYFLFRLILMLLTLNDVKTARDILATYNKENCHVLVEYAYLIVEASALGSDGYDFYKHLRFKFQLLARRDPSWNVLFEQIDHAVFGQPKKQDPMTAMLQTFMGGGLKLG